MNMATTDKTYRVQPTFLEILRTVGAKGEIFTLNQVFSFLKEYIRSRVLYDTKDPRKVYCENDALGKAFGVNMFTLDEVMKLVLSKMQLEGNVLPKVAEIGTIHNACGSIEKRRLSDDLNNDASAKRFRSSDGVDNRCWSPMFLELGASPVYDSSTETVVSVQGYETAFAIDESDDLWYLDDDLDSDDFDSDDVSVEFEVMSVTSSHEDEISNSDDSYIAEFADGDALIGRNDSDVEFWADKSDSDEHSSDPDLCDADNWKCKHCGLVNRPLLRYCQKCWQVRQGWLPGKRKRARKSRRKRQRAVSSFMGPNGGSPFSSYQPSASLEAIADGEVTNKTENVQDSNKGELLAIDGQEPSSMPSGSSGSASENRIPLQRSVSDSGSGGQGSSCMVCLTRPKNAILVHGRTGHQMCCYPCGKKLWETDKVCPICRRQINKVIRNFYV